MEEPACRPVYLDHAATTPVDPRVAEKMMECLTLEGAFGNPASLSHVYGLQANALVEEARENVAALIGAHATEIVWTSGATESDNLAIKGATRFYGRRGRHVVTVRTEHRAVLDSCRQLEREGYEVTYVYPQPTGLVDLNELENALRDDTVLVSVMHVNNEIGVVQDIGAISRMLRPRGIIFHVDAAQSAGKIVVDVEALGVDLMSLSAHKVYGPKGVGALYVRSKPRVRIEAQMHGGGHERGVRSGTLATHQLVGMGEAFRIAREEFPLEGERIRELRERLWRGLKDMDGVNLNGHARRHSPGILNLSFDFVEGEALMMALKGLAVSSGSACTSASPEPSYVLRALGRNEQLAHSSIRFGIGRFTTPNDVDYAVDLVRTAFVRLRDISPLWETYQCGFEPDLLGDHSGAVGASSDQRTR